MVLVVIPDDEPPVMSDSPALLRLRSAPDIGVEVMTTRPADETELARRIAGAHTAISIRATSKFTHDVLVSSPELRHIAVWGAGTDNVDLDAARRLGIAVTNTPGTATDAVAEHSLALLLALAKRVPQLDIRVRGGEWPRGALTQVAGKTIGIVGTGAIGARMAELARGIGMRVLAWTLHPDEARALELGVRYVDLETLLREADVVTVHLRLSEETRGLIGNNELSLMKPTALLVNTARGPLVDEAALVEALRSQAIGGAALDVFEEEPVPRDSQLLTLPNVILSPHTAGTTAEALANGLNMTVDNVLGFLAGHAEHRVA